MRPSSLISRSGTVMGYRSHLQSLPKAETSGTTHTRDLGLLGTAQERKTCISPGGPDAGAAISECQHVSSSLELSVKPPDGFPSPPQGFAALCQGCFLVCSPQGPLPTAIPRLHPEPAHARLISASPCNARAWSHRRGSASVPVPEVGSHVPPRAASAAQTQLPFPACSPAPSAALPVHRLCFHVSEPDLEVCVEILPLHLQHGHIPAAREL